MAQQVPQEWEWLHEDLRLIAKAIAMTGMGQQETARIGLLAEVLAELGSG
jgi:hypothetical protein